MTNKTDDTEMRRSDGMPRLLIPPPTITAHPDRIDLTISMPNTDQSWAAARHVSSMGSLPLPSETSTKASTQLGRTATPIADTLVQPEKKRTASRAPSAKNEAVSTGNARRKSSNKGTPATAVEADTNARVTEAA